jgi:hypothetical protein
MVGTAGNGNRSGGSKRGRIELIAPAASPEQAAAIVAALERFMRATAPAPLPRPSGVDGWQRTAMLEAVTREDEAGSAHPWINT